MPVVVADFDVALGLQRVQNKFLGRNGFIFFRRVFFIRSLRSLAGIGRNGNRLILLLLRQAENGAESKQTGR